MIDFSDAYDTEGIPFKDLYGIYTLSGCEYSFDKNGFSSMRFILDGNTYEAVRDPEDGYRSSLGGIYRTTENCVQNIPDVEVEIMECPESNLNGIQFVVREDGYSARIVITVVTDHYDSWYPCAVMNFAPENFVELRRII